MGEPLTLDDVPPSASRAIGAMVASAVGDALGWPIEPRGSRVGGTKDLQPHLTFIEWRRREGGRYAPYERTVPAGTYSDDTQLMLSVARSLTLGSRWWEHLTQVELPVWTLYDLGGGGAVRRAASSWARGTAPWEGPSRDRRRYFDAGANGAVMRVLPHSIRGARGPFKLVAESAMADGIATHGHPRALVGSLALAFALWKALRWEGQLGYGELLDETLSGRDAWGVLPPVDARGWAESADGCFSSGYRRVWERTVEEMEGLLLAARDGLQRGSMSRDSAVLENLGVYGKEGGAGTRTAAAGLYLAARYVVRPPAGLLAAAFARKADTDTIACVTGALLGALAGPDWLRPITRDLQDREYISALAEHLVDRRPAVTDSSEWRSSAKRRLMTRIGSLERQDDVELPLFGSSTVFAIERPQARSAHDVGIWWLRTRLGQTIAITKIARASSQSKLRDQSDDFPKKAEPSRRLEQPPKEATDEKTQRLAHAPPTGPVAGEQIRPAMTEAAPAIGVSTSAAGRYANQIQSLQRELGRLRLAHTRALRAGDATEEELARWREMQEQVAMQASESAVACALLVRDVDRSVHLYCDILRLPLGRRGSDSAVIGRALFLRREVPGRFEPSFESDVHDWRAFDAGRFVTVWMQEPHFQRAYRWLVGSDLSVTRIVQDSLRRFRLRDYDGHLVEVISRVE